MARGVYRFGRPGERPPGEFRCFATSLEAAERICRELARDERGGLPLRLLRSGKRPYRRATPGNFPCGHPHVPENSYVTRRRTFCRICNKASALRYYWAHRDRIRLEKAELQRLYRKRLPKLLTPEALREHQLARLIYDQLRWIMRQEGAWDGRKHDRVGGET